MFTYGTIVISTFIGTLTFTGSFIAFGKIARICQWATDRFPHAQQIVNGLLALILIGIGFFTLVQTPEMNYFYGIIAISAILGITLTIPIGGADMPVVISLLNSYWSGRGCDGCINEQWTYYCWGTSWCVRVNIQTLCARV